MLERIRDVVAECRQIISHAHSEAEQVSLSLSVPQLAQRITVSQSKS